MRARIAALVLWLPLVFVGPARAAEPSVAAEPGVVAELGVEPVPADRVFRWFPDFRPAAAPRWALALGGGGSWGLAHVGVLQGLEEDGLRPDLVAGTSIGSLIGAFAATGASPYDLEAALRDTDWDAVLTRNGRPPGLSVPDDPLDNSVALLSTGRRRGGAALPFRGLIPDGALNTELVRHLAWAGAAAHNEFDRLAIPFRAVASDLASGTTFAPPTGSLVVMVRASIGLPVFRPVRYADRVLVDGGVLENVPVRTARAMGAEAVLAVQLTKDGRPLPAMGDISSFAALAGRTIDVSYADQRRAIAESADGLLNLPVGDIPFMEFNAPFARAVEAGRAAWLAERERLIGVLEAHARDRRRFAVRALAAGGAVDPAMVAESAVRLGLDAGPREISALRLELELARVLRRGGYADGRVTVYDDGRAVLTTGPGTVVRALTVEFPPSLATEADALRLERLPAPVLRSTVMNAVSGALTRARRRGLFLCSIKDVQWNAETGALHVVLEEGTFARVEARSSATLLPVTSGEALTIGQGGGEREADHARDQRADVAVLMREYVSLYHRGQLSDVSGLDVARRPDGRYDATLYVDEPPMWELAVQPGLGDILGPTVWTRWSFPSLSGWKHWDLDLRLAAWRLGAVFGFEVGPPGKTVFFRILTSRVRVPTYTDEGDLGSSRAMWLQAGSVGVRTAQGRFGRAEALLVIRNVENGAFAEPPGQGTGRPLGEDPKLFSSDLSLEATWSGDRRDDPRRPFRGLAWSVTGIAPLYASKRAALGTLDLAWHVPLTEWRRLSAAALVHVAEAQKDRPLPLDRWSDAGAWWQAPSMLPMRGMSPSVRRGTLVLRGELGVFGGATIVLGASGAAWQLGETRVDPAVDRTGHGVSVFADVYYGRFGPVTVGWSKGSLGANAVYLLAHPFTVPWPGPRLHLPGR